MFFTCTYIRYGGIVLTHFSRTKSHSVDGVKEKLLQFLLQHSQSMLMSTGCPIDKVNFFTYIYYTANSDTDNSDNFSGHTPHTKFGRSRNSDKNHHLFFAELNDLYYTVKIPVVLKRTIQ